MQNSLTVREELRAMILMEDLRQQEQQQQQQRALRQQNTAMLQQVQHVKRMEQIALQEKMSLLPTFFDQKAASHGAYVPQSFLSAPSPAAALCDELAMATNHAPFVGSSFLASAPYAAYNMHSSSQGPWQQTTVFPRAFLSAGSSDTFVAHRHHDHQASSLSNNAFNRGFANTSLASPVAPKQNLSQQLILGLAPQMKLPAVDRVSPLASNQLTKLADEASAQVAGPQTAEKQQSCLVRQVSHVKTVPKETPSVTQVTKKSPSTTPKKRKASVDSTDVVASEDMKETKSAAQQQQQQQQQQGPKKQKRKTASPSKDMKEKKMASAKSPRVGIRNDSQWLATFKELKAYKNEFGNCLVPRGFGPNPSLASWVAEQRKQFKRFQHGNKSTLTQDRIDALNTIDFAWNAQEAAWNNHYANLKQFKEQFGHCHVSLSDTTFSKLGLWVKEQRRHYGLMQSGRPSHMNAERIKSLNEVEFCWDTHEATWLGYYHALVDYKNVYGDCLVPEDHNVHPGLGGWVDMQRRQRERVSANRKHGLNHCRIDKLDKLGFVWARQGDDNRSSSSRKSSRSNSSNKSVGYDRDDDDQTISDCSNSDGIQN